MCSHCKPQFRHYLIKHDEASCPFQQSRYCSLCAEHGPSNDTCPDPPASPPLFVSVGTLIPKGRPRVLKLINNDDILKSFLQAVSRLPTKSIKSADLRKIVGQYALEKGRQLILIQR